LTVKNIEVTDSTKVLRILTEKNIEGTDSTKL